MVASNVHVGTQVYIHLTLVSTFIRMPASDLNTTQLTCTLYVKVISHICISHIYVYHAVMLTVVNMIKRTCVSTLSTRILHYSYVTFSQACLY